ncbi:hypothetical protein PSH12_01665 [Enterococcus casseliflavus]|uniref:hypothetical protein n=1 Tax=Enterococcus TaxID=1350 RepID=UPI002954CCC0|nr:hypothetical protein [Enterococcus casseliflavus]MDV7711311.1 hypothetical protein [Enterococcus casseliflavus]
MGKTKSKAKKKKRRFQEKAKANGTANWIVFGNDLKSLIMDEANGHAAHFYK